MNSDNETVLITFPDLTPATSAQAALELNDELIKLGFEGATIRIERSDDKRMDLGNILVITGTAFLEGLAKRAGEKAFDWLCRKYRTRIRVTSSRNLPRTFGEQYATLEQSSLIPRDLVTLGVVILGASSYPDLEGLDNLAFARSARLMKQTLTSIQSVFREVKIIDLFDRDLGTEGILDAIEHHIDSNPGIQDLLIYYCGHGSFLRDRSYFLTLRGTRKGRESSTSLRLRDLRLDLEHRLINMRLYIVLDCCFAGEAVKEFMSDGLERIIEEQVHEALPPKGWAVLAASSRTMPAMAPAEQTYTMFTGALGEVLNSGVTNAIPRFSLRDLSDQITHLLMRDHGAKAVYPQCHAPRQDAGDVSRIPLFFNRAAISSTISGSIRQPASAAKREDVTDLAAGSIETRSTSESGSKRSIVKKPTSKAFVENDSRIPGSNTRIVKTLTTSSEKPDTVTNFHISKNTEIEIAEPKAYIYEYKNNNTTTDRSEASDAYDVISAALFFIIPGPVLVIHLMLISNYGMTTEIIYSMIFWSLVSLKLFLSMCSFAARAGRRRSSTIKRR